MVFEVGPVVILEETTVGIEIEKTGDLERQSRSREKRNES